MNPSPDFSPPTQEQQQRVAMLVQGFGVAAETMQASASEGMSAALSFIGAFARSTGSSNSVVIVKSLRELADLIESGALADMTTHTLASAKAPVMH